MTTGKYPFEEIDIEKSFDDIDAELQAYKAINNYVLKDINKEFENTENEIKTYQNLCSKCKTYIDQCIKESKHTIILRAILPCMVLLYFCYYHCYFYEKIKFYNNGDKCTKQNQQFFIAILTNNCSLLTIPLIFFVKSYGEKYKNDYFIPGIKKIISVALRKIKNDPDCQK